MEVEKQKEKLQAVPEEPLCLLTKAGRTCVGGTACGRCGWNPKEHERRARLPMKENEKGLLYMDVGQPKEPKKEEQNG